MDTETTIVWALIYIHIKYILYIYILYFSFTIKLSLKKLGLILLPYFYLTSNTPKARG